MIFVRVLDAVRSQRGGRRSRRWRRFLQSGCGSSSRDGGRACGRSGRAVRAKAAWTRRRGRGPIARLPARNRAHVPDRVGTGELIVLLTSILNRRGRRARADKLAAASHQRREQETGNYQLKTHLRRPGCVLQSRLPDLVHQESRSGPGRQRGAPVPQPAGQPTRPRRPAHALGRRDIESFLHRLAYLPPAIMAQLCAQLPLLERGPSRREIRVAVELLMDTGRRPEEILRLRLDCLTRDPTGRPCWSMTTTNATGANAGCL
jgi:integrase